MARDVAESADRPADDKEIEVTPEMIEAGVEVYWDLRDNVYSEALVARVYRAMALVGREDDGIGCHENS
jgi:hypothetical protein